MTILRQFTWALLATGALSLAACSEQAVEPTPNAAGGDILSAKSGGGKPGSGTPADPAIAFSSSPNCAPASGGRLYVVNTDGSNLTDIQCDSPLGESAWLPAWSPDGKSIAFYHLVLQQLVVVDVALDADGQPIAQNPRVLVSTGDVAEPAWSPLGDVIAYSFADTLYTVPAGGGSPTAVCLGCGGGPTWSPDGTKLAFVSNPDALYNSFPTALKTVTLSTGAIQTLIPEENFEDIWQPDWSRSGDRIAFEGTPLDGGPRGTYVLDLGTGIHSLVTDLGWPASWSPDDQQLVVRNTYTKSGNRGGLRVVNSVTGETVRLMVKIGIGIGLDWRRCAPGPGCGPGN